MDFIIATIGLGFLMAGVSTGRQVIDGSPLYYHVTQVPAFYIGSTLSIISVIAGFFFFGFWWIAAILLAWLPLNYYISKIFAKPTLAAIGFQLAIVIGTVLLGVGLTIAE